MIRIIANVSKKLPIPGQEFSSQQYMAGIEVEVSDGAAPEQIQQRIAEVYAMLEGSIDREIAAHGAALAEAKPVAVPIRQPVNRLPQNGTNGKNGRNGSHATEAQVKAIFAIARALGMSREEILAQIRDEFSTDKVESLSVRQASSLIEGLKARQNA